MPEDHDVDQVAMVSRNPDGSAAQTPGYEVLDADAAKEADEARGNTPDPGPDAAATSKRRSTPKGEKATDTPAGEHR